MASARGATLAGVLLAVAVAVATLAASQAPVTEHSPVSPPGDWRSVWIAALIAAFALYVAGLVLARSHAPLLAVAAIACVLQLLPLAGPLLLSNDVYSYWDYGRIAGVHGANPYDARPSEFPSDPAYGRMGSDWREKRSVYGPGFTGVSEAHAAVAGTDAGHAATFYRVLAAAGMCVVVLLIAWHTRSAFATAFAGWNPLLPLHFAGGGHNDALMAAALTAAVLCAGKRHQLEGAAWVVAASVKIVPLVFLPLRLVEASRGGRRFGYRGFAGAALAVGALAFALYGWHWLTVFTPVANQLRSSSSLGLPYWAAKAGLPGGGVRLALLVAFAVAYVWLLVRAARGRRAELALAAGLLLVATAWLQPWYAVWAVPLAALDDDWRPRGLALVLSAYFLRDALPL